MGGPIIYLDTFGASGGVGRVTRELVAALTTVTSVKLAGCSHVVDSLRGHLPVTVPLENLTPGRMSVRRIGYEMAKRASGGPWNLSTFLLSTLRRRFPEVPVLVNFPQILPAPRGGFRYSVFLHDLNWLSFPGNFENPAEIDSRCRTWCAGADFIFCNSEFTGDEVLRHYGASPERTIATPLAPFPSCGTSKPDLSVLERLCLVPDEFFLFPGVFGLHKGHDILAEALQKAHRTLPVVVTCGKPDGAHSPSPEYSSYLARLAPLFRNLQSEGKLRVFKGLSDAEMSTLRQTCRAFVLPSRYEGYGFPLAEAVMLKKPVIYSDIAAFREIVMRHQIERASTYAPDRSSDLTALLENHSSHCPEETTASDHSWTWESSAQTVLAAINCADQ